MTSAAITTYQREVVKEQIDQYRKDAEKAKKELNYEFAFLLMDQTDTLERELLTDQ